jgi:hypothetical protein
MGREEFEDIDIVIQDKTARYLWNSVGKKSL